MACGSDSDMGETVIKGKKGGVFRKTCPWCSQWPEVQTHGQGRYWAICVNEGCPVGPVTVATSTPEAAVTLWNSCKR